MNMLFASFENLQEDGRMPWESERTRRGRALFLPSCLEGGGEGVTVEAACHGGGGGDAGRAG